jgi:WD40 repeat protein
LTESVRGLINQLFSSLEYEYGQVLVSSVLGFITFSVGGLNINHIQDLLSMDDDVVNSTFQYSKPSILQIPIHVILRLYQSLCGLVVEREQGKIYWYHRQLKETAEHRYQVKEIKCRNLMAVYFSSTLREDIRKKRLISEQPVFYGIIKPWFKNTNINVTLCTESIPQMLKSENYEMIFEAYKRLCSLDYICASVKVGEGFHLVNQFLELESVMEQSTLNYSLINKFRIAEIDYNEALIQVKHYLRWLRKDMNTIVKDPSVMLTVTATAQSQLSAARKNILSYIVSSSKTHGISFQEVSDDSNRDYWYRSRLLGGSQVFDSCLMVFPGHSVSVEAILRLRTVSFSKDCSMIVSGSDDHGVRVWDVKTGMEIQNFLGHSDWIKDVSFAPCMRKILSCSSDKTIRIWNVVTGVEMSKIEESTSVNSAKFCPIGSKIVSGSDDTSVRVWDAISCLQLLQLDGHRGAVLSVSFCPTGSKIVSGSEDTSIRIWDATNGTSMHQLDGHKGAVISVSFCPTGSKIVSASYDTSIRIWDAISGTSMHQLDGHKGEVFSACFSPCGRKILSGGWDQSLRIW